MTKEKSWKDNISPLAIGQILLMANIVLNIFVKHEASLIWLKYVGFFFLIPVIILWPLPFFTLRKHGNISASGSFLATTQLVKKGIYKLIRHPQYLSFMLLNAGMALINQDIITIVISFLSIVFLFFGIKEEEQILNDQFGEEYTEYLKRVPSINILAGIFCQMKKKP
jgi:protein-S-isoprenylcysteine O-methyltransferase Ste14